MSKITVNEYIENENLLELTYSPYEDKINIVDLVIDSCIIPTEDNLVRIDSVLLDRISKEIFLSSITNIDMEIISENNITPYDELCRTNKLEELIDKCGYEYTQFEKMLKLRKHDFDIANNSIYTIINYIFDELNKSEMFKSEEFINQLINQVKEIELKNKISED